MLHQLLSITATAEQCFRLIPTRHVGLVGINIMPMLARPTCYMLSTRTCMCQHNVFRLVPTPPLQFLHELTVHGYMYTYALCYDTRHIMHALALPQPNPHQPPRLKDNCVEPVGVIFWLCWFPWFAFFVFLTLVDAAWPRGSREVSGSLKWPRV